MGKNIKISIDFEGPFGMYPYIKSQNSIKKYYQLDESIRFILDYHKKNKIIITLGILGVTAIKEFKDLIKVIPTPMRPFQGWRYYMEEDIPPDLNINDDGSEEIPDEVNSELIKLGLY